MENELEVVKEIVGTFDGQNMWGEDNRIYPVHANYASKSKLVEGDKLKLMITNKGEFMLKQIGPVARVRVLGRYRQQQNAMGSEHIIDAEDGRHYKVLYPSVSYFKVKPGEQVVLIIPASGIPEWGAVENVIRETTPLDLQGKDFDPKDWN